MPKNNVFQEALTDYNIAEIYKKLGKSSLFNRDIAAGIVSEDRGEYKKAISYFEKGLKREEKSKEAKFYKISAMVKQYKSHMIGLQNTNRSSEEKINIVDAFNPINSINDTMQTSSINNATIDEDSRRLLTRIKAELDAFINDRKNEHMLYYFRGILSLYLHQFFNAISDFERVTN